MTLEEFYKRNEYLYHLTSPDNADAILSSRYLLSAEKLISDADLTNEEKHKYLTGRRPEHLHIISSTTGLPSMIRDQQPISEKALVKTLTNNMTAGEFILLLNSRVFFWPTLKRLNIHYTRYQNESPAIIRVKSRDMIESNLDQLKFCRLNSGATRCHPKWKAPPPRGMETFVSVNDWEFRASDVAEVTFETDCVLPDERWVSQHPDGPWTKV